MKYFLDTEFLDDGETIELISIGIVSEDGRELYCENDEFDSSKATPWLKEHVIPNLFNQNIALRDSFTVKEAIGGSVSRYGISQLILRFLAEDDKPEFWGYFADYDWVVFCQLFGPMVDLPKPLPHFCMDLMQLQKAMGVRIKQENSIHNALEDARWIKDTYERLTNVTPKST